MAFASDKGRQGAAGVSTGYDIDNSLRFNDDDSAYLSRTPSTAGNRKTWTWSGWVKRGNIPASNQTLFTTRVVSTPSCQIQLLSSYNLRFQDTGIGADLRTSALLRDSASWYHIQVAVDTTQATSSDRVKIYINGEQVTDFSTETYPSLNGDTVINSASQMEIGTQAYSSSPFDGYLAEVNFVDGQALTPADFGETDEDYGHWKAKAYEGTYGTNGFYLDFKNSGSLGNDANGSNNWTPNNLAATDQMLDSPTNNFCTLNPLHTGAAIALSEGNLKGVSGSIWRTASGTLGATSGKWYWEQYLNYKDQMPGLGWTDGSEKLNAEDGTSTWKGDSQAYLFYEYTGGTINAGVSTAYASAGADGALIGIALDIDNGKIWFSRNGVWLVSGNPSTATSPSISGLPSGKTWLPFPTIGGTAAHININFGQDSSFAGNKTAQGNADGNGYGDFYYAPPTGFLALCTQNLPEPTVVPSEHFNTVTWAAESPYSDISITGVGFQPDFVWAKHRTQGYSHTLFDAVRGVGKALITNATNAEETNSAYGYLGSFDSDGFTGTEGSIDNSYFNYDSTSAYVAWNWKANGTGVSNTNGSITSTVSANADAGFSIVSWTGTGVDNSTIGHGLSKAPEMIITKKTNQSDSWNTFHKDLTSGNEIFLDLTSAQSNDSNNASWGDNHPASVGASTFAVGYAGDMNGSGVEMIAYCFHSVDGYSKVGSYTGNGSTDGTFVHCGFRPAYVMVKVTSIANDWVILDGVRSDYNPADEYLVANASQTESSNLYNMTDFTANGFKLRDTQNGMNGSNDYIFIAFAEVDFKHSNAR